MFYLSLLIFSYNQFDDKFSFIRTSIRRWITAPFLIRFSLSNILRIPETSKTKKCDFSFLLRRWRKKKIKNKKFVISTLTNRRAINRRTERTRAKYCNNLTIITGRDTIAIWPQLRVLIGRVSLSVTGFLRWNTIRLSVHRYGEGSLGEQRLNSSNDAF